MLKNELFKCFRIDWVTVCMTQQSSCVFRWCHFIHASWLRPFPELGRRTERQYTPLITSQFGDNTLSGLLVPPTETSSRLHCSLAKRVEGWTAHQFYHKHERTWKKTCSSRVFPFSFFFFSDDCTLNLIAFPKVSQSLSSLCFSLTLQVFHGVGHGLPDGVPSVQSLHLSLWNPVHGLLGVSTNSLPRACADSVISHSAVSEF